MSCRDQFSPLLSPPIEYLIIRYWLKHFLLTNSILFLICWDCGSGHGSPKREKQNAIGQQKMYQPIAYDQWLYRKREQRAKLISASHFCSRSPMSPSRKWTRKPKKRSNPSLWADHSGKICDKKFISTLHKNYSFVRRLQNCVEWYGPFSPWHPSFKKYIKKLLS